MIKGSPVRWLRVVQYDDQEQFTTMIKGSPVRWLRVIQYDD